MVRVTELLGGPFEAQGAAKADDQALNELREAYRGGNLVLFIGLGVSASAGLPSWDRLIQLMLKRARWRVTGKVVAEIVELSDERRYIDALTAVKAALGKDEFATVIERHLEDRSFLVPEVAEAIASLAPRLRAVLTTNVDHIVERAFDGAWPVLSRVTDEIARRRGFILKLHGTLTDRATWIFSREEYERAVYADPKLLAPFSAFFHACPILFVGYGLGDDDFRQILGRVRALAGTQPPLRFVLAETEQVTDERRRLLEKAGVHVIPYENPEGTLAGATQILKALAASASSAKKSDQPAAPVHVAPTLREGAPSPSPLTDPPPAPGVPYDRRWYVHRDVEERLALTHLDLPGAPVVLWGPELFGKSTTLSYLLDHLREADMREGRRSEAVVVNLPQLLHPDAPHDEPFFALARYLVKFMGGPEDWLAECIGMPVPWPTRLTMLMEKRILPKAGTRLLLAMEQADAAWEMTYQNDFYGMLRAWCGQSEHEPWSKLRLVLAISTTPALLFDGPDARHSPWNLLAPIELRDFRPYQVEALARLYGLDVPREVTDRLQPLVGGHPFLLRMVMHGAQGRGVTLSALLDDPAALDAIFSQHLASLRERLEASMPQSAAVRRILADPQSPVDEATYQRLRRMGLVARMPDGGTRVRFPLYEAYLRRAWNVPVAP
jgi:AAA-like domain/SIR2-like domain